MFAPIEPMPSAPTLKVVGMRTRGGTYLAKAIAHGPGIAHALRGDTVTKTFRGPLALQRALAHQAVEIEKRAALGMYE